LASKPKPSLTGYDRRSPWVLATIVQVDENLLDGGTALAIEGLFLLAAGTAARW
jgi:hypothetical protein